MRDAPEARAEGADMPLVAARPIPCTSAAFAQLSAEILRAGSALRFRARGASMSPLVRDGDVVLVRPVDPGLVRVGDVVLCRSECGRTVLHRVIRREVCQGRCAFIVQGDRAARADGLVPAAEIYGRVASVERHGAEIDHIDLDQPGMRWLGWLAVLRSRLAIGRFKGSVLAQQLVKRLPVVRRYLA